MTINASFAELQFQPGGLAPSELERAEQMYEDMLLQTDSSRIAGRLARTYAEALLVAAERRNEIDAVAEEFLSLEKDVFPAVPGLEAYLDTPSVNRLHKDEALAKLFEGRATPLFLDFLRLLNRKSRLALLRLIGVAFRALLDNRADRIRVLVETAVPLSEHQQAQLRQTLAESLGKTPVLVIRDNPALIGGLVVHVGDKVFDTSVRSRLQSRTNQTVGPRQL